MKITLQFRFYEIFKFGVKRKKKKKLEIMNKTEQNRKYKDFERVNTCWEFSEFVNDTQQQYCSKLKRSEERREGKECRSRWTPYH